MRLIRAVAAVVSINVQKGPKGTWLSIIVLAVAVPAAVIVGLVLFDSLATPILHTNPAEVPSMNRTAVPPAWAGAAAQARKVARAAVVDQNRPGLSVAVGIDGEIVWAEGFGWANLEKRVPVAPEMKFRIGHASKPLTSAAVGLLAEQKRLNLDDEIQEYVPGFPRKKWPITLRQLMGHVAGIRHYRDTEWGDRPTAHCDRASEGLASFANAPLLFEPGTRYKYSTYGWVLISAAVEAVANEPFFAFMRRHVFAPIGMTGTTPDSATEPMADRATPYHKGLVALEPVTGVEFSCFAGAGGFLSTPSDLARFGLAVNRGTLLQASTVRMLQTPQVLASGEETDYGLGWMLETITLAGQPARMAGHSSRTIRGGTTTLMTFPERGLVVAVMTNTSLANTKSIAWDIAEAFAR